MTKSKPLIFKTIKEETKDNEKVEELKGVSVK